MSSRTWRKSTKKYGIAIANFDGSISKWGLTLQVGETVHILEEFNAGPDGWYRGFSLRNKQKLGIFPAHLIHIKPCDVDHEGLFGYETIIPIEDPVLREISYVLREWSVIWKKHYIVNERQPLFRTILKTMQELVNMRGQLVNRILSQEGLKDLKMDIIKQIDWGNGQLGMDLVPRIDGEQVEADKCSITRLHRIHQASAELTQDIKAKSKLRETTRSRVQTESEGVIDPGINTRHILVSFKNFGCNVGDPTEALLSLYYVKDTKDFTAICLTEKFVLRHDERGMPVDPERFNNYFGLFMDLTEDDLQRDLYMVAHIYRIGTMKVEKAKAKYITKYKRPWGVGVEKLEIPMAQMCVSKLPASIKDWEFPMKVQSYNENEAGFPRAHEAMIRKLREGTTITNLAKETGPGLCISVKVLKGDITTVKKEDPMLFSKGVTLIQRLGFSEIITPGEVRNDLYVTLLSAEFERGSKKSNKNVEVKVTLFDANNEVIENCISSGCGELPASTYYSSIFYHSNKPEWNEIIKLSVPIIRFSGSHILFEFSHCSTRARKAEKQKTSFAFIKIVDEDRIVIKDDTHHLLVYKYDDHIDKRGYVNLPFKKENGASPHQLPQRQISGKCTYKISGGESFTVSTLLCSGKFTQSEDLLGILNWRAEHHRTKITENLTKLENLKGEEIVKFLSDILDKLFEMFECDSDKRVPYEQHIFLTLVHVFTLLHHSRFENFKPVLEAYISDIFSATLVHRPLLRCFAAAINSAVQGNSKHNKVIEVFQVIDYMMRFIVQSRQLQKKNVYSRDSTGETEFQDNLVLVFRAMGELLSSTSDNIKGCQMTLLSSLHMSYAPLFLVLSEVGMAQLILMALDEIPESSTIPDDITKAKLELLRRTMNTKLFTNDDSRQILLPMCLDQIQHCMTKRLMMQLTVDLFGDILEQIFVLKETRNIQEDIQTIVQSLFHVSMDMILGLGERAKKKYLTIGVASNRRPSDHGMENIKLLFEKATGRQRLESPRFDEATPQQSNMSSTAATCVSAEKDSLKEKQKRKAKIARANINDSVIACLTEMLRLMDQEHYSAIMQLCCTREQQTDLLTKILVVFRELVKPSVFPADWTVMRMVTNNVVFTAVEYFSQKLTDDYGNDSFEALLWNNYFNLAVAFITQPSLQLHQYSKAKAQRIKDRYQDMRVLMGVQVETLWHTLAGEHKQHFIPVMVGPFLQLTLVPELEVRKATLPIISDMLESDLLKNGSILRFETAMFERLDFFLMDGMGDKTYAELFKRILLERVQSEPALKENGEKFIFSVTDLLERLLDYRQVMDGGEENRDKRMHCSFNILNFYKENINREEMYIRYVHKLYDLHIMANNYVEAGLTLQLYAKLLTWNEDILLEQLRYQRQPQCKRKEMIYHEIINCFDRGKVWEYGIPMCKDLAEFYEKRFEYKKLGDILRQQATFYNKILEGVNTDGPESEFYPRQDPTYYRVVYYGQSFPAFVRNKAFIYRGDECLKLSTLMNHLMTEFPSASIIKINSEQNEAIRDGDQQYIQICSVKPLPQERPEMKDQRVPREIVNFYNVNEVDTFESDHPYHRGTVDKENESKTLCLVRKKLKASYKFPGILRWYEVVEEEVQMLCPIQVATEIVRNFNSELEKLLEQTTSNPSLYFKNLTMKLQGGITAAVNGGITKYHEAFFTKEFEREYPAEQEYLESLQTLLEQQVQIIKKSLKLHAKLVPDQLRPLHESFEEGFKEMTEAIFDHGTKTKKHSSGSDSGRAGTPSDWSSDRSSQYSQEDEGLPSDGSSLLDDILGELTPGSPASNRSNKKDHLYYPVLPDKSRYTFAAHGGEDVPPPIPSRPQSMVLPQNLATQLNSSESRLSRTSDPGKPVPGLNKGKFSASTGNLNPPKTPNQVRPQRRQTQLAFPTQPSGVRYTRRPSELRHEQSEPTLPVYRETQGRDGSTKENKPDIPPKRGKVNGPSPLSSPRLEVTPRVSQTATTEPPPPLPPRRSTIDPDEPTTQPERTPHVIRNRKTVHGATSAIYQQVPPERQRQTSASGRLGITTSPVSSSSVNGLADSQDRSGPPPIPGRAHLPPPPLPKPSSSQGSLDEEDTTTDL